MKKLFIFAAVFHSFGLYSGIDGSIPQVPRFFSPDITLDRCMCLSKNAGGEQDSRINELKKDFRIALERYKMAILPLRNVIHGFVIEEKKASYWDRRHFIVSIIKHLFSLGFNLDEMFKRGRELLFFWFRTNLTSQEDCDVLCKDLTDFFTQTVCAIKKNSEKICVIGGQLYMIFADGGMLNLEL